MTDHKDARQLLADITAGLEGVTPGPWRQTYDFRDDGEDFCHVQSLDGLSGFFLFDYDCDKPVKGFSLKDGGHIARCDPDTIKAIADLVATQAQRIAELEAERQWRLIKTAPRDKTHIFIAVPTKDQDGYLVGEAYFDPEPDNGAEDGEWWWAGTGRDNYFDSSINEGNWHLPTHWQHLPPAPLPASPHEGTQS